MDTTTPEAKEAALFVRETLKKIEAFKVTRQIKFTILAAMLASALAAEDDGVMHGAIVGLLDRMIESCPIPFPLTDTEVAESKGEA